MENSAFRLGVIGIGRMGSVHAKNLFQNRVKGAILAAVCDTDQAVLDAFLEHHPNVKGFGTHQALLASGCVDGVIVATPHYDHVPIAISCMMHGVHVLSEKPAAVTIMDAKRAIMQEKQAKNVRYGIVYNQRTNPVYQRARELVNSGALGEIKRATFLIAGWYRSQAYYNQGAWRASWQGEGGGLLMNQCVHQLDVLQWVLGMPTDVTAFAATKNRNISVENEVIAVFAYPNGARLTVVASGHELGGKNRFEIVGDKGKLFISDTKLTHIRFQKSESEVNAQTKAGYGFAKTSRRTMRYGLVRFLTDARFGQQRRIVQDFVQGTQQNQPFLAEGKEGILALSLINGIYLSAARGKRVLFPLDENEVEALYDELRAYERAGGKGFPSLTDKES